MINNFRQIYKRKRIDNHKKGKEFPEKKKRIIRQRRGKKNYISQDKVSTKSSGTTNNSILKE
jgi:hypothetical protein